jgi:hypothetical protein
MFKTLSQIAVNYRGSALSCGEAGGITGGDRLPWIGLGDGKDNFAPLASIGWQVHVYGKPRGKLHEACAELHLPLHLFPWKAQMRRAGLCQRALYLIRPDGYVALADRDSNPERLQNYFEHEIYRAKSAARDEAMA